MQSVFHQTKDTQNQ